MTTHTTTPDQGDERRAEKVCTRCKQAKPFSAFHRDVRIAIGFRSSCRECESNRVKGRKLTPEQKARQSLRDANRHVDPKKLYAKHAVAAALRSGQITRWPVCAMPECERTRVEAHHADYDNPLGVTWLCTKHHRLAHNSIRSQK